MPSYYLFSDFLYSLKALLPVSCYKLTHDGGNSHLPRELNHLFNKTTDSPRASVLHVAFPHIGGCNQTCLYVLCCSSDLEIPLLPRTIGC